MPPEAEDNFGFPTPEEKNDFLKTRIERLGLSPRIEKALSNASIRTIGGLVRKSAAALLDIEGLGVKGLEDIQRLLKRHYEIALDGKVQRVYEEQRPLGEAIFGEQRSEAFTEFFPEDEDIVEQLARHFGTDKQSVLSHSRQQELVEVRDIIVYLLREYGGMSFPALGRLLGNRDHTTMIHSYRKMCASVGTRPDFGSEYSSLIAKARLIKERRLERSAASKMLSAMEVGATGSRAQIRKIKEIPERNMKIMELYREGLTLDNIGKEFGITRERVRQIVIGTVRQMASNESISKGIVMDFEVLIEEESRKRHAARDSKRAAEEEKEAHKEKRWSVYYPACKSCGTTAIPHVRKGLCEQCVGGFRGELRENIIAQHGGKCEECGRSRAKARMEDGRDFYITKSRKVLCRRCFLKTTGKKLGSHRKFEWSRLYPACVSCGTTSVPHVARGLCDECSDIVTNAKRQREIEKHGSRCDRCGATRAAAQSKDGRDLYVTHRGEVLCRQCFQKSRFGSRQNKQNART